ncbi:glycosyltransferase [Paenibacillus sp. 1011MAR3C5]|uniref:glycosyltransferase n=1 Tax=Paenibacillus sp. 1011MAR3C5 TaxID=1675787 RepID=UPI000E6CD574|nr:glycosyltransferase [Paenibacillus sp. 1011MAR3C5]RJE91149.1 glycosyltransferase [Paenibacillus sp. 1011MAR3C5]
MKKKLLFVMPSLAAGGGEKSLVTMLSHIDFDRYEVDLFLFNREGIFLDALPKEVRLLDSQSLFDAFMLPLFRSVRTLWASGHIGLAYSRLRYTLRNRYRSGSSVTEQHSWKYMSRAMDTLEQKYDVAIGFLEKSSTYFCVDKVRADKRIGWIHIDYDKLEMDPKFDKPYFGKLDHIITVSEECEDILKRRFPEYDRKISTIYNIVSPTIINRLGEQQAGDVYGRQAGETILLTIGRLHAQKGLPLAVEACATLVANGYNIRWFIIGEGEEREALQELIRKHGMEERFILLGLRANPYPYTRQCDIYVQPSRFEGKSIAIDEAKIMHKPIVVTNFSTAKDQIRDGANGLIASMDSEGVATAIARLIDEPALAGRLAKELSEEKLGTEEEIHKLYKLVGG